MAILRSFEFRSPPMRRPAYAALASIQNLIKMTYFFRNAGLVQRSHHVAYLALFGSVLTSQFTKTSDVDVLIRFAKNHTPHLLNMIRMESELSALIGYLVDLKIPNELSSYSRNDVLAQAKILYGK